MLVLSPGLAWAKLPFFGLDVDPTRPAVGDPVTITMTCYLDEHHTQARPSCFGDRGVMAWVHPLDDEGRLQRTDWIPVLGHGTSSGASRGRIRLDEPGSYDVLPLWRSWGPEHSPGFPDPIRIEVADHGRLVPIAVVTLGVAVTGSVIVARRRRAEPATVTP